MNSKETNDFNLPLFFFPEMMFDYYLSIRIQVTHLKAITAKVKAFWSAQLILRITPVQKEGQIEHCCVVYYLDSELKFEEIRVLPHGNASKRTRSNIRTSGETMVTLRNNLFSGKSVIEYYKLILED